MDRVKVCDLRCAQIEQTLFQRFAPLIHLSGAGEQRLSQSKKCFARCMLYDMKLERLQFKKSFRVIRGNRRAQAAEMVITPGNSEGDSRNRHRGADQWLYVVAGRGDAVVKSRRYKLVPGTLIFIGSGERHEIKATGRSALRTLNFYAPPAYSLSGDPLPRGRR
jgi:mannose-6-phosphate isomerase-like protein (cupin superfamily)